MKWSQFLKNQLWIGFATTIPFTGSFILSFFVENKLQSAYGKLVKPVWAPPGIVNEGIVMLALTVFGYGSYLVWIHGGPYFAKTFVSLVFYSVTLILEWIKVVFAPSQLDFATVHSSITLIFASITGVLFFLVDKKAGFMCIILICWLIFSTFLFYNLWTLNSDGDWFANRDDLLNNIRAKNKMLKS